MYWRCRAPGLVTIIVISINPSFQNHYNEQIAENYDKQVVFERRPVLQTESRNTLRQQYSDAFWNFNRVYFQSCQGAKFLPPCDNCVDVVTLWGGRNSKTHTIDRLQDHLWSAVPWTNPYTNALWVIAKGSQPACIKRVIYTVKPPQTMQVGSAEQIYRAYEPKGQLKRIFISDDCSNIPKTNNQICGGIFVFTWDTLEEDCSLPVTSDFECTEANKTCLMSKSIPGKVYCGIKSLQSEQGKKNRLFLIHC